MQAPVELKLGTVYCHTIEALQSFIELVERPYDAIVRHVHFTNICHLGLVL